MHTHCQQCGDVSEREAKWVFQQQHVSTDASGLWDTETFLLFKMLIFLNLACSDVFK